MPSGPKKRRAAKRKNEAKAMAKQTDVSVRLAKGADLNEVKNTIEEVSYNSKAIQEKNEVPMLDVTSNEDILVSNDEPVLSKTAGCIMERVESDEILQENESCGVETEQLTSATEQKFEMLSDDMTPEEMLERDVPVVVPGEAIEVEVLAANEAATVGNRAIDVVADVFKDVSLMENVIEANEESLLHVTTNEDKEMHKDVIEANEVSQNSSCIAESVESGESVAEVKKDVAPWVFVNVLSNESIKDVENVSVICDQSTEVVEGMKDVAQLVSYEDTVFNLPNVGLPVVLAQPSSNELSKENASSSENIGCFSAEIPSDSKEMQASPMGRVSSAMENQATEIPSDSKEMQDLPKGTVSPATENQVTYIPSDSKEMQAVPKGTVPPATDNQVYFACPVHCKAECSFSQLRGQLTESVVELKSAIHRLKEDLEKTLDKLDCISY